MIQLATDPTASRTGYGPAPEGEEGKGTSLVARRSRTGHAWPFLAQCADRHASQSSQKPAAASSGS
ncbi:MAG: hypothetical protein ABIU58_11245 [Ramlibacter sp.]